jgi:DNA processing protein
VRRPYIDVGRLRNRLKSLGLDLSHLTAVVLVANCIPLVTTAVKVLEPGAEGYPQRLTALGVARRLHVRGALCEGPAIAIVGARAASGAGIQRAHTIAKHLAERGVHVVSGGALGIDGAAHRGALAGGGSTIVVLGSGVDIAYPSRHAQLFEEVVARGGALVSQFPIGMAPRASSFTQRNTLISALADAVIVVEADLKSGSLSTAHAARRQRRSVAACPGTPGCARLLATGAAIVESAEDAFALAAGTPRRIELRSLDQDATAVRDALAAGATGIDSIVRHTGLPVRAVLRVLPQLELSSARLS